jgi:hypothetical protein
VQRAIEQAIAAFGKIDVSKNVSLNITLVRLRLLSGYNVKKENI